MVCDYYVECILEAEYTNGRISQYEFTFHRKWYPDFEVRSCYEEDDEDQYKEYYELFHKIQEDIKRLCLIPRKPVIIYENGKFTKSKYETEILEFMKNKMGISDMTNIVKMTRKEIRYSQYD